MPPTHQAAPSDSSSRTCWVVWLSMTRTRSGSPASARPLDSYGDTSSFASAAPFVARYPFGQHFRRCVAIVAQAPLQVRKKIARDVVIMPADLALALRARGYRLPPRFWWRGRSGINPCMADTRVVKRHGLRIGALHYLRSRPYTFRLSWGSR
jgi:hypothetical protein